MGAEGTDSKRRRPAVRFTLVGAITVALAWLIASTAGFLDGNPLLFWILSSLSVVILMIAVPAHLLVAHRAPTRRGLSRLSSSSKIDLGSIRREHQDFGRRFTSAQMASFVQSVFNPRELRGRVNEEIQVRRRVLRQKVSTILEVSKESQGEILLFPIMMPLKGELQDDLSIALDGEPVATLTHREYLVLVTLVMDTLLTPAPGVLTPDEAWRLEKDGKWALKIVSARGKLTDRQMVKVEKCSKRITRLASRAGDSLILAAVLLRRLANNYVIVGVLPGCTEGRNRRTISYERYLIPSLRLTSSKSFLGLLMDSRPKHVSLDLSIAATAHSYHLFVMGPEGTYVGWQNLTGKVGLLKSSPPREKLTHPYGRFRRRLGQRYLHLYLRSVPPKLAQGLRLDIKFFELPPGSMAGAALAATANFALVLLIALILPGTYDKISSDGNPLGSDFPALVLAFPAIAGAFVGYDNKSAALVGGTLSSKLSSLLTIVLSLAASGLFMAQQAQVLRDHVDHGVLGIHDFWWQVVTVGALLNTIYATYTWLARTLSYYWLAHRPGDEWLPGPAEH